MHELKISLRKPLTANKAHDTNMAKAPEFPVPLVLPSDLS